VDIISRLMAIQPGLSLVELRLVLRFAEFLAKEQRGCAVDISQEMFWVELDRRLALLQELVRLLGLLIEAMKAEELARRRWLLWPSN